MEKEAAAFERLHALVRKGYVAQIGSKEAESTILLHHLGKAPDLVLYPDGRIEPFAGRIPRYKRRVPILGTMLAERDSDHVHFMKFLETVPKPKLRDRTRPWRKKYLYVPAAVLAFWGMSFSFTALLMS